MTLITLCGFLAHSDLISRFNAALLEKRMAASPVSASGQIVLIAIDARSLRAIGTWPWSRVIHADLVDRMTDAGALDVFFDIDFAFAADSVGDAALVAALERATAAMYFAAFAQSASMSAGDATQFNLPHAPFRDLSWPASANITAAPSGQIQRYPTGTYIDGTFVPSAGTVLAGRYIDDPPDFGLNFAISPQTVPTVSAIDVLDGTAPPELFAGRSVIIGASAVELGDMFPIPVHGIVPGAMIHAFAAETLLADMAVVWIQPIPIVMLFASLFLLLSYLTGGRPWRLLALLGLCLLASEAAALAVFRSAHIAVPTGFLYPAFAIFGLGQLARSLDLTRLRLRRRTTEFENTQRLLKHLFDDGHDAVVTLDEAGNQILSSPSALILFGGTDDGKIIIPEQVRLAATQALDVDNLAHPARHGIQTIEIQGETDRRLVEFSVTTSDYRVQSANDRKTWTKKIATITARDVTTIRQQERQIAYLSAHDELTDALRRNAFLDLLGKAIEADKGVGVFALNLRRFNTINVTLGRRVGDAVLAEVVRRLGEIGPELSTIVRLDGDGFGFFVEGLRDGAAMTALATTVQQALDRPYVVEATRAQVGTRVGVMLCQPGDAISAEQALSRAEEALDAARDAGAISLYDPEIAHVRLRTRELERNLAAALDNEEFHLVYQPQVRVLDGALIGVEALVRWTSPALGAVSPTEFIEIAEASGFIHPLGSWVLDNAIRDATHLPDAVEVAVNVSGHQLQSGDVAAEIKRGLDCHGLDPSRLCLEVTETVLLSNVASTVEIMRDVTWLGAKWALDDFGTGYSSLAYLSDMPLSKIKLDRAFVKDLETDPSSMAVLRSVRVLCDGLGMELLCEGVETRAQFDILRREGCQTVQGFLFGRPQSIEAIREMSYRGAALSGGSTNG